MSGPFLKTLAQNSKDTTPVWLMRQAGRYLSEYKAVRNSEPDFISFCLNSEKAVEVTLQPIDKFDFDAAIIFSDILLMPWAMKRNVRFIPGTGPVLDPLDKADDFTEAHLDLIEQDLKPVGSAIKKCRSQLSDDKALLGFAGAPWTIITYLIEGGSSRDFSQARKWLWHNDRDIEKLLETVTEATIRFLEIQARAGADALMIFDSWASAVPAHLREKIVIEPARQIIEELKKRGYQQPVIGFPKGIGEGLLAYCDRTGVTGVGLDHGVDPRWATQNLPTHITLQGNLDPLSLIDGGQLMEDSIKEIMDAMADRSHIFNLGHGITPETPIDHVFDLVKQVRQHRCGDST